MQIRDLEYFAKLAELKNFTQVANYFHVSQPTITYAIKRVEHNLNVPLIQRDQSHHSVALTPAGQQFVVHIQNILGELDLAQTELHQHQQAKIHLGLPPIIGNYFFPKLIPKLTRSNLISRLITCTQGSENLLSALLNGDINLAFLGSSKPLVNPDLHLKLLAEHQFNIVTSPDGGLAHVNNIAWPDLKKQHFITFNDDFVHRRVFNFLVARYKVKPEVIYETDDVNILKEMVAQDAGVALLTNLSVKHEDHLHLISLAEEAIPKFKIYLAYRRDHILNHLEKQFIEIAEGN